MERIRPSFEAGGRLHAFRSVYEGMDTFLFTPRQTAAARGAQIHDALDSKRIMIMVIVALLPCFFFGMYNTGYQHWLAAGATSFPFWELMLYGFLAILPCVIVTYAVGLGIEFAFAQWRGEEIQEGFLVTGLMIPLILPVDTPVWMVAVATAFAVIFAKEVFGGTGYNIFNVALVARAFLFFAYPAQMSGDSVFVSHGSMLGVGGCTCRRVQLCHASGSDSFGHRRRFCSSGHNGASISAWDAFLGLIPGSFGETSVLCILIGAAVLLLTRVASWRIMFSVVLGGLAMGWLANVCATPTYPASYLSPLDQLLYGGFAFAAVFMATDPVTAARTRKGQYVYGFLIGVIAVLIRTYNAGYPEGAMLAVLLMNAFAPLIDYFVVQANIRRRRRRSITQNTTRQ